MTILISGVILEIRPTITSARDLESAISLLSPKVGILTVLQEEILPQEIGDSAAVAWEGMYPTQQCVSSLPSSSLEFKILVIWLVYD